MPKSRPNQQAGRFNARYPIGTAVRYWTGVREGEGKLSHTRSIAEVLGGHTAVVWIEGESGCVALSHVVVVREGRRAMMDQNEYLAMQRTLLALSAALVRFRLTDFLSSIDHAQAVGPVLDPTLYRRGMDNLQFVESVARVIAQAGYDIRRAIGQAPNGAELLRALDAEVVDYDRAAKLVLKLSEASEASVGLLRKSDGAQ